MPQGLKPRLWRPVEAPNSHDPYLRPGRFSLPNGSGPRSPEPLGGRFVKSFAHRLDGLEHSSGQPAPCAKPVAASMLYWVLAAVSPESAPRKPLGSQVTRGSSPTPSPPQSPGTRVSPAEGPTEALSSTLVEGFRTFWCQGFEPRRLWDSTP